jgi:hypothetical protein
LDAQTSVARLKEQLRGDAIALNILESMMDEMRPRDTQQFLGISAEVYWAARKRIRRQALPGNSFHGDQIEPERARLRENPVSFRFQRPPFLAWKIMGVVFQLIRYHVIMKPYPPAVKTCSKS